MGGKRQGGNVRGVNGGGYVLEDIAIVQRE